jgi:hypothetical protein
MSKATALLTSGHTGILAKAAETDHLALLILRDLLRLKNYTFRIEKPRFIRVHVLCRAMRGLGLFLPDKTLI